MKKLFFLMLFIPIMVNAQQVSLCECVEAYLAILKDSKETRNEEYLDVIYKWTISKGSSLNREEFISNIQSNKYAFEMAFEFAKDNGFKSTKIDFALLVGITDNKILKALKMNYEEMLKYCKLSFEKMSDIEKNRANEEVKKCPCYSEYSSLNGIKDNETETFSEKDGIDYYFYNGVGKYLADQYRDAIIFFDKALEIDPKHIVSLAFRGVCKNGDKDYIGAIADFNKAIELGKPDTFVYASRANSKLALGDYRGAILDCNTSIGMNINYSLAYNTRAKAKFELKDFKGALMDFNKVIQLDPKDFGAYYNRGLAKYALADKEGACLDFSKAGELGMAEAYELIREHCN